MVDQNPNVDSPISTYNRRGCGKAGIQKFQHSIIYTGREEPAMIPGEEASEGEEGMLPPIRVVPRSKSEKMDRASRINYGRIYTVEHYVRVKEFGDVHEKYIKRLRKQWWYIQSKEMHADDVTDGDEDDAKDEESSPAEPREQSTYLQWVTACWDFNEPRLMKMKKGDRIGVTDYTTSDWWKGLNVRTNEVNLFPSNYVRHG
jgi:hypothetical protein